MSRFRPDEGVEEIETVALDDILGGKKVTFIKMDIEGAEYEALLGARKLIMENRPSDIVKQMQLGQFYGMNTFDQSLAKLYKDGIIDMETAQAAATSPDAIMLAIRGVTDSLQVEGE